jgi:hypothetical protein
MKKLKHESELFKAALIAGVEYAEGRKAVEFEATDSASDKALYIYRLLVHDKIISPMPETRRFDTGSRPGMPTSCPKATRCWIRHVWRAI